MRDQLAAKSIVIALVLLLSVSSLALADPLPPLPRETEPLVSGVVAVAATVDPTFVDTAVTDDQLAGTGMGTSTPTVLLDDPTLLIVDDDRAQCPNAQFTTAAGIQQAIAAAPVGGKIRVCPGTYTPITIARTLTLQAPRYQGQANGCNAPLPADPTKEAIIDGDNIVAGV